MTYGGIVIVLICIGVVFGGICWVNNKKVAEFNSEKRAELIATSKAVKRILLNNRWGSIDDKIDILIDNSISIDFGLGVKDERTDI